MITSPLAMTFLSLSALSAAKQDSLKFWSATIQGIFIILRNI